MWSPFPNACSSAYSRSGPLLRVREVGWDWGQSLMAACNPGSPTPVPVEARGVFAVTRHPMMWAFALWGICHIAVYPVAANIIVAAAIIILALVGTALQDRKKEAPQPNTWPDWEKKTSYWPFGAIVSGKARFGGFGMHALAGGVVLWLAATWAHIPLAGWPAGRRAFGAGCSGAPARADVGARHPAKLPV